MPRPNVREVLLDEEQLIDQLKAKSKVVKDHHDLRPLFDRIGDAQIVLLGEASHGTHEYYTWRSYISQRLIKEKGFKFIGRKRRH